MLTKIYTRTLLTFAFATLLSAASAASAQNTAATTTTTGTATTNTQTQKRRGVLGTVFGKRERRATPATTDTRQTTTNAQTATPQTKSATKADEATTTTTKPLESVDAAEAKTADNAAKNDGNVDDAAAEASSKEDSAPISAEQKAAIANRRAGASEEEQAVVPYYNNFLSTYRLGPDDVISITVFGQPNYSRASIVVPPDGRVNYPLVGTIFVAGRTTNQLKAELTKKFDEYVIDPDVTVSLERAGSATYTVVGDIAQPGVKLMTRRLSVREAIAQAGGVLPTGKKKVFLLRAGTNGTVDSKEIDVAKIEKGKAPEIDFLVPGDQIIVPGNVFKTIQKVSGLLSIVTFAQIFRGF